MNNTTQNTLCKPYDGGIWIPSSVLVEMARLNTAQKQSPRLSGVEANRRLGSLIKTMQQLISEEKNKGNNPMSIPDLEPMYQRLKKFIKAHQGEKGFILTGNPDNDTIWAFCYCIEENSALKYEVKAVRVNKHGNIQVVVDFVADSTYTEEKIKAIDENRPYVRGSWLDLKDDDDLYYIPTIFNIAPFISEYV